MEMPDRQRAGVQPSSSAFQAACDVTHDGVWHDIELGGEGRRQVLSRRRDPQTGDGQSARAIPSVHGLTLQATMDVEAQDDGVMGKILVEAGASDVPVGKLIAVLADEGADLSPLEIPSEDEPKPPATSKESSAPKQSKSDDQPKADSKAEAMKTDGYAPADRKGDKTPDPSPAKAHNTHPQHPKPLLPSVLFLLAQEGIEDATKIKATGKGGRLTKSDVLLHLGKLKDVRGSDTARDRSSLSEHSSRSSKGKQAESKAPVEAFDAPTFRRMVIAGLSSAPARLAAAKAASSPLPLSTPTLIGFDDLLDGYLPPRSPIAKLDTPLSRAPLLSRGLPKTDPLRLVLEA